MGNSNSSSSSNSVARENSALVVRNIPSPPNWSGEAVEVVASTLPNYLHLISAVERAAVSGLRPASIVFTPPLLRYAQRGRPDDSQQYTDPRLQMHFYIDKAETGGAYETLVQQFWPPTHDLRDSLNELGAQGWCVSAAYGTEPLVVVAQRKLQGDLFRKEYNYIPCPTSLAMGISHVPISNGTVMTVKAVQATLQVENSNGWRLACVWQHDEQENAALIMERLSTAARYSSLVIDACVPMRLNQRGQWIADFTAFDATVSRAAQVGWEPAGVITLPVVKGRSSDGVVVVAVLVLLQAEVPLPRFAGDQDLVFAGRV